MVRRAAEWHMRHVSAGRKLEHQDRKMRKSADSGRAIIELSIIRSDVVDQFRHCPCRIVRTDDEQVWQPYKQRNRLKIALSVVRQIVIHKFIEHVRAERSE